MQKKGENSLLLSPVINRGIKGLTQIRHCLPNQKIAFMQRPPIEWPLCASLSLA
jgi:hypothetical protein